MHFFNILPRILLQVVPKSQSDMSAKKRVCSTCKQNDRPFGKRKTNKDGLDNMCKDCRRAHGQINWASEIVYNSRINDRGMHRPTDSADYNDKLWAQQFVRDNPNSHYCSVPLMYGRGSNRRTHPHGLQLDRMESTLEQEHLKANCV